VFVLYVQSSELLTKFKRTFNPVRVFKHQPFRPTRHTPMSSAVPMPAAPMSVSALNALIKKRSGLNGYATVCRGATNKIELRFENENSGEGNIFCGHIACELDGDVYLSVYRLGDSSRVHLLEFKNVKEIDIVDQLGAIDWLKPFTGEVDEKKLKASAICLEVERNIDQLFNSLMPTNILRLQAKRLTGEEINTFEPTAKRARH